MKKLIIMCMVLLAVGSVQAQMLINGGFDDGLMGQTSMAGGAGVAIPGWTIYGYDGLANMAWVHDTPGRVQSGQGIAIAWNTVDISQDVSFATLVEGQQYDFSIDVQDTTAASGFPADDLSGWNGYMKAEIWDFDGVAWFVAETSTVYYDYAADPEDEWVTLATSLTIPALDPSGVHLARMTFGLLYMDATYAGTLDFDNASVVPEPATMAMLGLGGLLLRRRKK